MRRLRAAHRRRQGRIAVPDDIDGSNEAVAQLWRRSEMNLLLDTHIALWAIADSPRLPNARELIEAPGNPVWVSVASVWEIAIKHALAKG